MTTEAVPFDRTHIVLSPVDNPPNTCDALAPSEIAAFWASAENNKHEAVRLVLHNNPGNLAAAVLVKKTPSSEITRVEDTRLAAMTCPTAPARLGCAGGCRELVREFRPLYGGSAFDRIAEPL
jgi:hypothetical protein